jgi:hypothetical protein
MRQINSSEITNEVVKLCAEANYELPLSQAVEIIARSRAITDVMMKKKLIRG